MNIDKQQLEAFRVRQFSGPHPAVAAAAAAAAAGPSRQQEHAQVDVPPDADRVILHFDADSFYSQVEEVRDPSLRGRPVGVTQKYLVVTCNYAARSQGVTKLMNVEEAKRRCPQIVLVSGEDLTPYRQASRQIQVVLQRYGTAEKLGLDEIFVDATAEAKRRLEALQRGGCPLPAWQGHVHSHSTQLVQDSKHRPMDLRAVPASLPAAAAQPGAGAAAAAAAAGNSDSAAASSVALTVPNPSSAATASGGCSAASWEALLRVGSVIAAEARAAVRAEAGYRTSAGIACNKMLAKLCSGLHKPDDQTVLPPPEAAAFVAPLPVRALPGVGYKTEQELHGAGINTAADLRALPRHQLVQRFGDRVGSFLHLACRGKDPSPVQERGPPKSVTVEDSFKSCPGFAAAEKVVGVLAPDLLARLQEELQSQGRRPATLSVKWRHRGSGWQRSSASCPMPAAVLARGAADGQQVAALAAAAMSLLRRHLSEPFDLSLLNLGATAFSEGQAGAGERTIADMLAGSRAAAGVGGAAAGADQSPNGHSMAAAQLQHDHQQPQPQQQQAARPPAGRAAAEASTQQRRSYSSAPGQGPLLSKRAERQLREQAAQQAQQAQQQQAAQEWQQHHHNHQQDAHSLMHQPSQPGMPVGVLPPASWQQQAAGATSAQPAWQAQQAQHAWRQPAPLPGYGFQEEEENEVGDDAGMWEDLQGLAAWRSQREQRRSPAPAAAPAAGSLAAAGRSGGSLAGQPPQQHEQQPLLGRSAGGPPPQRPGSAGSRGAAFSLADSQARPTRSGSAGAAASLKRPGSSSGSGKLGSRVVIHCDVDCFYCAVERLDDPSLCGVPLAVQQFNAGGFVAVSYEARAAGIRCGDGAGAAGRAAIPHLRQMQAASLEECRRRCPGLQVRPMRTDRYRQVAQQVHALLRSFAPDGQVEKTSYDDFYLDVTAACTEAGAGEAGAGESGSPADDPPDGLLILPSLPPAGHPANGSQLLQQQQQAAARHDHSAAAQQQQQQQWRQLSPELRRGVTVAARLRRTLQQQLGLTVSCGVAANKLLARLASPLGKPDGLAAVLQSAAVPFICSVPLRKVPHLRGKFGAAVESELGISTVGDLAAFPRGDLVRRFGQQQGAFLAALPLAQDDTPVRERGPQKSLAAERSFPPLPSEAAAAAELAPLARTLLERAAQDARENRRLPSKLVVHYRQGYNSNPRSRSSAVPPTVLQWLQTVLQMAPDEASNPEPPAGFVQQPPAAAAGDSGSRAADCQGQEQLTALATGQAQHASAAAQAASPPAAAVVSGALGLLRSVVAASGWQLTRLAVALAYDDAASGGVSGAQQGPSAGQLGIAAFVQKVKAAGSECSKAAGEVTAAGAATGQLAAPPAAAAGSEAGRRAETAAAQRQAVPAVQQPLGPATIPAGQALHQHQQHQQHQQQQQQQQQQQSVQLQPRASSIHPSDTTQGAAASRSASYRNAEALAIQQMFGAGNHAAASGGAGLAKLQSTSATADGSNLPAGPAAGLNATLSPEEQASLELALRLQQEEVAAAAAARKRAIRHPTAATGGSGTRQPKQQRTASGPLDAFFKKKAA